MSIGKRIKEARNYNDMTQEQLAIEIGVTKGAIANYENEISIPKPELMYKLMEVLKCDANFLYQDMLNNISTDFIIDTKEKSIIKKYRSLDNHGKKNINNILDNEYDRCNTVEEETTPYLVQPYYTIGASAGNGEYLFEDLEQSEILLPDTVLNRRSDFIIDVKGSSMEPTYYNGDKLLVTKQDELNIGDIGIFIINGESFVKELGNGELISHNNNYQNISLNEFDNIKTIGKVIGKLN